MSKIYLKIDFQRVNERKWKISGNFKARSIENPGGVNLNN